MDLGGHTSWQFQGRHELEEVFQSRVRGGKRMSGWANSCCNDPKYQDRVFIEVHGVNHVICKKCNQEWVE